MERTIYAVYRDRAEWDVEEIKEFFGDKISKYDVEEMIWGEVVLDYNIVGKFENQFRALECQDSTMAFTYVENGKFIVEFAWTEEELYDDDVSDVSYKDMIEDINGEPMVFVETMETIDINCSGYDFERGN